MKYVRMCQMLTNQDMIVSCCTIAMYDEVRAWNRAKNKRYVEVFLDVPFEVLRERDQKGLDSAFENGEEDFLLGNMIMFIADFYFMQSMTSRKRKL